jgi:hypothetical protein
MNTWHSKPALHYVAARGFAYISWQGWVGGGGDPTTAKSVVYVIYSFSMLHLWAVGAASHPKILI